MSIFDKFKRKKEEEKSPQAEVVLSEKKREDSFAKKDKKRAVGESYGVLIKPLITEKATFLGQYGQYIFEVAKKANKIEISKAIEKAYGVKPVKINILGIKGKNVRYGKKMGKTKDWRKAIVMLPPGAKIEVHEGI